MIYSMATRQQVQLILAVILITGTISVVAAYVVSAGFHDPLVIDIVKDAKVLLAMAVGAAMAYFGLGRTVTDDNKPKTI